MWEVSNVLNLSVFVYSQCKIIKMIISRFYSEYATDIHLIQVVSGKTDRRRHFMC
jgi:hypothetical protein